MLAFGFATTRRHELALGSQSAVSQNVSPIIPVEPVPSREIPLLTMEPSARLMIGWQAPPPWVQYLPPAPRGSGSIFGTTNGLMHRGWTGVMLPVTTFPAFPEFDGLKTSAAAVALMLFPVFPQMREKNVGRLLRWSCTVTIGFTPNPVLLKAAQSALLVPPLE